MPRKIQKVSRDHICANDEPPNKSSKLHSTFTNLPNEILSQIVSYLTFRDLLNLRNANISNITEITLHAKCADFSEYSSTVSEDEVISFFTRDRVAHIQQINFNNVFRVESSTLEECAIRCKHLKILHANGCGLSRRNILSILEKCRELEELYWSSPSSLMQVEGEPIRDGIVYPKLKKLYFTRTNNDSTSCIQTLSDILDRCACSVEACLNASSFYVSTLPPSMGRKIYVANKCSFGEVEYCYHRYRQIFENIRINVDSRIHVIFVDLDTQTSVMEDDETFSRDFTFHSSYLQLITEDSELSAMPTLPDNGVHSLVLIMTKGRLCLERYTQQLKQLTGKKLRNLTVHEGKQLLTEEDRFTEPRLEAPPSVEVKLQRDFVIEMVSSCENIQVLNLSEVHFDEALPFASFCCLKNLKVLNLSACSIGTPLTSEIEIALQKENFERFINCCKKVEAFLLYGCLYCRHGPTDEEMMSIAKWPKLTHLLISKVHTFRFCSFLPHIVESCPNFISLDIYAISSFSNEFMPFIHRVLKMSKKLKFFRLHQYLNYPVNSMFWRSVSSCKTLQGLCVATEGSMHLKNKTIMDAIVKLPLLHLFHLNMIDLNKLKLRSQIWRLMTKNGVKHVNIDIDYNFVNSDTTCTLPHLPL